MQVCCINKLPPDIIYLQCWHFPLKSRHNNIHKTSMNTEYLEILWIEKIYVFSQVSNTPPSTIGWKIVCPMSLDKYSTIVFPLFRGYQHTNVLLLTFKK